METSPDVYFLNLDRHKKRLDNMAAQLNGIGLTWERVAAIDAQQANEEELDEYVDAVGPIPRMGAAARAVTAGHFIIWKKFLETDAPIAFVLEDDVRISESFPQFVKVVAGYSNDVDIFNFNRQDSKRANKKLAVSKIDPLFNDVFEGRPLIGMDCGTSGYMITRSAAERLCHQIRRTNAPIDHLLFNPNVSSISRSVRIYQAFPAVVGPDVEKFQTSIQNEAIPTSTQWHKKLLRAYCVTNRLPSMLLQCLLGRAKIQILDFN